MHWNVCIDAFSTNTQYPKLELQGGLFRFQCTWWIFKAYTTASTRSRYLEKIHCIFHGRDILGAHSTATLSKRHPFHDRRLALLFFAHCPYEVEKITMAIAVCGHLHLHLGRQKQKRCHLTAMARVFFGRYNVYCRESYVLCLLVDDSCLFVTMVGTMLWRCAM